MIMKYWKLATITTALVLSTSVNAALIDNGLLTTDTESGLNWLDLTETNGMTFKEVSSQLSIGGQFEGYRYASTAEVVDLWSRNFGIDLNSTSTSLQRTSGAIDTGL